MSWEAWGDPPDPPEMIPCPDCDGQGLDEDGDSCDHCDGDGEVMPPEPYYDDPE